MNFVRRVRLWSHQQILRILSENNNKMNESVGISLNTKRVLNDEDNEPSKRLKLESDESSTGKQEEKRTENTETTLKRKKIALLMGYSGRGYYGMQRNPGVKTIEEDLLLALFKTGVIFKDQFETPQSTRFQRSCRTDKGVSASRQIVSLIISLTDNLAEKLNEHLPEQIRVFGYKRVTRGFNCKTACDARTYSYTLPTFAFAPIEELTTEDYRISKDEISKVNEILAKFKGTHLFHNFTAGKSADDASCQRYIIEFECGEPFVRDGLEFLVITVKGQSFMLHQIRKMIGLTIAIARGLTSVDTIIKAWCPQRIDLPIAPGLGLVLEEVHYDKYNKRYGGDGMHESLLWNEYNDQIAKFKEDYIYPTIVNTEKNEKSMLKWLDTLMYHTFDVREPSAPSSLNTLGKMAYCLKEKNNEEPKLVSEDIQDSQEISDKTTEKVSEETDQSNVQSEQLQKSVEL